MTCFAFHETAVELAEIVIFESFAEAFEAFATAGFDEGEDEQTIEKPFFVCAAFYLEFHQLVNVHVFSLGAQPESAFLEFGEDQPEMAPFFGDDGGEVFDEALFVAVALNEGDAAGCGLLFAPGVVGEDGLEGDAAEVDPTRVGWKLESEDVLLTACGFHGAKLRRFARKSVMRHEPFLNRKLAERRENAAFRELRLPEGKVDLCSNDYLGIARNGLLERGEPGPLAHGSGGSRLLAGNYALIEAVERQLADFHGGQAALIYNSGYDANVGLLSCVPQRGDVVLYDALSHASIRDGMRLSFAQAFPFLHNDCGDLERRLSGRSGAGTCFVVTESVFSMDGDLAPLTEMAALCRQYGAQLIVDEAHATGVVGKVGEGLVAQRAQLQQLIIQWRAAEIGYQRLESRTPIQVVIVPGNDAVRAVAARLQATGLDVRPILYPTVPKGSERLRIVLHAFNTVEEIKMLADGLKK